MATFYSLVFLRKTIEWSQLVLIHWVTVFLEVICLPALSRQWSYFIVNTENYLRELNFFCLWYKALLYIWMWQHFKGNCSPLFIIWIISNNKYVEAEECGSRESPANTYRNSLDPFLLLFSRFSSRPALYISETWEVWCKVKNKAVNEVEAMGVGDPA